MKLFAFLILFLVSCNSSNSSKKTQEEKSISLAISDYVGLMGSWSMCKTYDGKTVTLMNVCPTIIFNSNGTGQVRLSSPEAEEFSWTIKNKNLIIKNNTSSNSIFPDTAYSISLNKQKNSLNLTIEHSDHVFYLLK